MTITLLNKREYNKLVHRYSKYPNLTFQNDGYEYIDKNKLSKKDLIALKEVSGILSKCIKGFSKFNNFCLSVKGKVRIRFQYDWTCDDNDTSRNKLSFIGVGYLELEELHKGFKSKDT